MKRTLLTTGLLILTIATFTQVTEAEKQLKTQQVDTLMGWKKGGVINLNSSQTSLTNWAAGGQSSIAIGGLLSLYAHNKQDKSLWENYLDLGYGTCETERIRTGGKPMTELISLQSMALRQQINFIMQPY